MKSPSLVQVVGLAAQRATDDLLAEELRAEGADAEDVGDGVGVPAFGQHRDRDDAADGAAELARLADGVHDLAEQLLVGDVVAGAGSPVRSTISRRKRSISSAAMPRKLSSSASPASSCSLSISSVFGRGERVAGDSSKLRNSARRPFSSVVGAVFVLAVEAGDEVVDELRDGGVLADDDEAGRHLDARFLPELEGLLVVAVERFQRGLQARRKLERVELLALPAALLRHVLADVLPEVAEHRHLVAGDVLRDGDARQLDDAALDGVHEREVAHRPREERAFGVARAAEEERRRGEIDDAA